MNSSQIASPSTQCSTAEVVTLLAYIVTHWFIVLTQSRCARTPNEVGNVSQCRSPRWLAASICSILKYFRINANMNGQNQQKCSLEIIISYFAT